MNNILQEKEYKILISEEQYHEINAKNTWDKCYVHTNYYYDTTDLQLHNRGITCRIRARDGQYKLQVKYANTSSDKLYKTKKESESEIDGTPSVIVVDGQPLIQLGFLRTQRKEKLYDKGIILFLDYNCYLGETDYELEVEFDEEDIMIERILSQLNIKVILTPKGKRSRFVNCYLKKRGKYNNSNDME